MKDSLQKILQKILSTIIQWKWEDTWQTLGYLVVISFVIIALHLFGFLLFGAHDIKPYVKFNSYYQTDANYNYVIEDSTKMIRTTITTYSIYMERKWDYDRLMFETEDLDQAKKFLFDIDKKRVAEQIKQQSLIDIYRSMPFKQKIEFLTEIDMVDLEK